MIVFDWLFGKKDKDITTPGSLTPEQSTPNKSKFIDWLLSHPQPGDTTTTGHVEIEAPSTMSPKERRDMGLVMALNHNYGQAVELLEPLRKTFPDGPRSTYDSWHCLQGRSAD